VGITVLASLVSAVAAIGTTAAIAAATTPSAEKLAAREAARQRAAASGHRSKSVVVDGTPRKLNATAAQKQALAGQLPRRSEGALRAPRIVPSPQAPSLIATPQAMRMPPVTRRSRDDGITLVPEDTGIGPMRSLSTFIGEAGMASDIGGDDIVIAESANYDTRAQFAITSGGVYYVAVGALTHVDVFKSTDGGETWTLWSTLADPGANFLWIADMLVAEGTSNRIFVAYPWLGDLKVAWADITLPVPTWTIVTALDDTGISHGSNYDYDIDTDAAIFSTYYVYVVARGRDATDNADIWFTRSTSMGDSYDPGYRIADTAVGVYEKFTNSSVSFGHDNFIHASYDAHDSTGTLTYNLLHRRVPNWGDGGSATWETANVVNTTTSSDRFLPESMAASTTDGTVLLSGLAFAVTGGRMFFSTDYGVTWPVANQGLTGLRNGFARPLILASGEVIMGAAAGVFGTRSHIDIARSSTADLTLWSAPQTFTENPWATFILASLNGLQVDPTRGNQVACVWIQSVDPDRRLRFDAEWRRDPGYGNTDVGFPLSLAGGGQTPPAIAEIDGDPFGEIVFATISGDIHVLNHNGTVVPGWPVNIGGTVPLDGPVAVGDLTGNGVPTIAIGDNNGQVFAYDPQGNLLPGWPVQMDSLKATFVSIGALGPPATRYVVAACSKEIRALRYDGEQASFWGNFTNEVSRPAAIGDVDNDGVNEVVTVKDDYVHVMRLHEGAPVSFRWWPLGKVFSDAPTLGDIDNDGDLEIAVPTTTGEMYLLNHDCTDYSVDWPITMPSGQSLTSACFANILGNSEVELTFAERDGSGLAHIFGINGTEQPSYPTSFGDIIYMPPIVARADVWPGNVVLATPNTSTGYSTGNLGHVAPGWPRNMPGKIEETPAGGDIDLDGRNEIVFVGIDFVTVFDVGVPTNAANQRWPMYQHNAQRTGCFNCEEVLTGVGDVPGLAETGTLNLNVYPNPLNPVTTVSYEVTTPGPVSLVLYNVAGRVVDVLLDGEFRSANRYAFSYEPRAASGVYFLRLESGGEVVTRKISLLK